MITLGIRRKSCRMFFHVARDPVHGDEDGRVFGAGGREIKQILLIHANSINSDYLDDIAKMLEKRNYKFITLQDALTDEAYKLPDTFVKRNGISWLHRWALAKGRENIQAESQSDDHRRRPGAWI